VQVAAFKVPEVNASFSGIRRVVIAFARNRSYMKYLARSAALSAGDIMSWDIKPLCLFDRSFPTSPKPVCGGPETLFQGGVPDCLWIAEPDEKNTPVRVSAEPFGRDFSFVMIPKALFASSQ
jgi:hypothetical protein